jgi:DNA-directed RNA polymerase specialized sigma subunit
LYGSMKNLIYDAARKASFGSNVPESAHRIYAAQNFLDALRTFNPNKGRALQSHVYDTVHQKAKRLNYLYQNLGSMPEPRAMIVGLYQSELENLKNQLGREPSAAELSDRMSLPIKEITNIRKELRKDLAVGEGTEDIAFSEGSREEESLEHLYYDLGAEEKVVYEYIFGKHGKPRLVKANNKIDFDGIARRMGVSSSKVRTVFSSIKAKLEKAIR